MAVDEIFKELRAKGLVTKATKCKRGPVSNFKAGVIFRRTILFNKKYADLGDDLLRFALLHEEGHHRGRQYSHLVLELDIAVVVASIALVYWCAKFQFDVINPIVWGFLPIYVWLILSSMRIFSGAIQKDELSSDLFSAQTLKDAYAIDKPSTVADQLFRSIVPSMNPDSLPYRIMVIFFGAMHPENEERVRRIKEAIDDRP